MSHNHPEHEPRPTERDVESLTSLVDKWCEMRGLTEDECRAALEQVLPWYERVGLAVPVPAVAAPAFAVAEVPG